ncbi:MAG: methionine--tRNA ligase subunit beta, partial [Burkholderiales bacterium]|nr:methionine--tRNA ligase subunit beta [Burkholderiales bacterium]
ALKEAMNLARLGNKYLADTEPWKVAKTDMERVATILNFSLQLCARLTVALDPFLPFTTIKLRNILNMPQALSWQDLARETLLPGGHRLNEPVLLFDKIDDATIETQMAKLKKTEPVKKDVAPALPECSFADFEKMDIRVATVLQSERVPKTDKLLKLTIDTGLDQRVIVSGIAQYYTPEDMVGKQICILANLAPRTIRGIVSQGMILMAKEPGGNMRLISPLEGISDGAVVG